MHLTLSLNFKRVSVPLFPAWSSQFSKVQGPQAPHWDTSHSVGQGIWQSWDISGMGPWHSLFSTGREAAQKWERPTEDSILECALVPSLLQSHWLVLGFPTTDRGEAMTQDDGFWTRTLAVIWHLHCHFRMALECGLHDTDGQTDWWITLVTRMCWWVC